MCGRFTQAYTWEEVHEFYNLTGAALNLRPSYNVAPTQLVHIVRTTEAGRALSEARWGLVPSWWKKTLKDVPSTFNARSETAAEKPMFRSAFRRQRCLIPADGFYEWKRSGTEKQPYFIKRADGRPLTCAGLWETWTDRESGSEITSCTILTTDANPFMADIHHRMPVILERERFDEWLQSGGRDMLVACNDDVLACHPVSKAVGNVRNNAADLIDAVDI
jgi:putative SOS response-associated peptidase YedK